MIGMFDAADIAGIERTIQMAIAPAFLLTAIFAALNVLTQRLARLIDRDRDIRDRLSPALPGERRVLAARARQVHMSIACLVLAAVLLCLMIVISFIGLVLELVAAFVVAGLLTAAMAVLMLALLFFLAEIRLAYRHLPLGLDA
ncbi:DUF2721 domain-containing protein [Paracraurococcus ruber]|nr:DUF2721 domain-containing protein [Paracraurococcus ruber]